MKPATYLMLCWVTTGLIKAGTTPFSFTKLSKLKQPVEIEEVEEESGDDEYDDESDEEEVSAGFVSKILFASKLVTGVSITGFLGYQGFKLAKKWLENRQSNPPFVQSDLSNQSISELLTTLYKKEASGEEVLAEKSQIRSICLLFDCDSKISSPEDNKARLDYFKLMSNLTSNTSDKMTTIYIPSKSNGNIVLKQDDISPDWQYIQHSSVEGKAKIAALRSKLGVRPEELRIVILDEEYRVVAENALDQLRIDPKGMPWSPRSLLDVLGTELLAGSGGDVTSVNLKGKKVALYFSASWCKPCQSFLPDLITSYGLSQGSVTEPSVASNSDESEKASDDTADPAENSSPVPQEESSKESVARLLDLNTEVIFVSLDKDEAEFDAYRSKMPWPAVPFRGARRAELQMGLRVRAIPSLVVFDEDGCLVTSCGVTELRSDPTLRRFPWSSPVVDLSDPMNVERLERGPVLIAFAEGSPKPVKQALLASLQNAAKSLLHPIKLPRSPREDIALSIVSSEGKLAEALRTMCKLPPANESLQLVVLDLSQAQFATLGHSIPADQVSETLNAFLSSYLSYDTKMVDIERPAPSEDSSAN